MVAKVEDLQGLPYWPLMLSAPQAAVYLGLSEPSFQKAVDDGDYPPPTRRNGRVLWNREALERAARRDSGLDPTPLAANDASTKGDALALNQEMESWQP
jgi:predicted DNA-binding transcriptional regulator AlpA